ncbi:hypothetical protein [Streptomyces sp. CS159]|uniref:hypothetical protein n=1 Tax=Streptomyces sp. CS159 TaxID=1982762 RepID=UPI000B416AD3|nr:hypothetical protein [Streptomyces sp. CS159]
MKTSFEDRHSRLIIAAGAGAIVFALVLLFALLVHDADGDDSGSGQHTGHCAPALAGTVDPATCLPYGSGAAAPGTNDSRSSVRKPAPAQPKQPAAKAPAVPKAPAAPPRVSLGKR